MLMHSVFKVLKVTVTNIFFLVFWRIKLITSSSISQLLASRFHAMPISCVEILPKELVFVLVKGSCGATSFCFKTIGVWIHGQGITQRELLQTLQRQLSHLYRQIAINKLVNLKVLIHGPGVAWTRKVAGDVFDERCERQVMLCVLFIRNCFGAPLFTYYVNYFI